ncbi:MAG: DNA polymerase III subunit delta [Desulfobacteraceae bacterium Eth-SRB2]|nr:MAG: DNA polymerase III subunit delta [Desulfobacteraceae bacterium Eth-SRB2]
MTEINYRELNNYLKNRKAGDFAPVYLIYGQELLYKNSLEVLVRALIPASQRSLGYEPVEGTNENIKQAIERSNTYSLLSGTKVVAICDSKIFYSKQDHGRLLEKAKQAYDANDIKKAATYLLSLLSLLNLSYDDVSKANRTKTIKLDIDRLGDDQWIDKTVTFCIENSLAIASQEDNAALLQNAVEKGFPKGNHLIITTDMADKRRKLFKTIREQGVIIDCSVPTGDRRADRIAQEAVLSESMNEILGQYGKRMDKNAYLALYEMTGFDLRTFSNNLQKLISYVGDRKNITTDDVESVLKRTKKDPIYDLTNAVSERNMEKSLFFLDTLLADNLHPLQVLAAITNQIRRLLLVKDFVKNPHGREWHGVIPFHEFKSRIMPAIQAYDADLLGQRETWDRMLSKHTGKDNQPSKTKGKKKKPRPVTDLVIAKNPKNPYPVYQMLLKSERFATDELIYIFELLSQTDLSLKSTRQNPKLLLGKLILFICQEQNNVNSG